MEELRQEVKAEQVEKAVKKIKEVIIIFVCLSFSFYSFFFSLDYEWIIL